MEIDSLSKSFSKKLANKDREQIKKTKHELEILQKLDENQMTQNIRERIDVLRSIENYFIINKIKSLKLRAAIPTFEDGELNIAYYTRLEKRKGEENLIFSLEEDGVIKEGTENVLNIYQHFYK